MDLMKIRFSYNCAAFHIFPTDVWNIFPYISWEAGIIFLVKSWNNLELIKLEAAIGKIWKSAKR